MSGWLFALVFCLAWLLETLGRVYWQERCAAAERELVEEARRKALLFHRLVESQGSPRAYWLRSSN